MPRLVKGLGHGYSDRSWSAGAPPTRAASRSSSASHEPLPPPCSAPWGRITRDADTSAASGGQGRRVRRAQQIATNDAVGDETIFARLDEVSDGPTDGAPREENQDASSKGLQCN